MPKDSGKELINFGEPVDMLTARVPVRLKRWLAELAQKERRSVSQQLAIVLEDAKKISDEEVHIGRFDPNVVFSGNNWRPGLPDEKQIGKIEQK